MSGKTTAITQILTQTESLARDEIARQLLPLVYDDLKEQAERYLRGEKRGHTLQPTALVHEAFLRLVDQDRVNWQGKTHFLAVAASIMRRVLIDHARTRKRVKRGAAWSRVALTAVDDIASEWTPVDPIRLHNVMEDLAEEDPIQAQIVELRFFGGLTVEEVAHLMGFSKRKVEGDWTHAKAWLKSRLANEGSE